MQTLKALTAFLLALAICAGIAWIAIEGRNALAAIQDIVTDYGRARAEQTRAEGEASVMESAAHSVRVNAELVRWQAIRGDVLAVITVLCSSAVLGVSVGVGAVLARWLRDATSEVKRVQE
jgi:hypothetical protein